MDKQENFLERLKFSPAVTICTWLLIGVGYCNFFVKDWEVLFSVLILSLASLIYFVYFFFKTGQAGQILTGIIITFLIMGLCAAVPIVGWIALILFILYNISKSFENIKNLLPNAINALVIYFILFSVEMDFFDAELAMALYMVSVGIFAYGIEKNKFSSEVVYLRYSILFLSIPLIILSVLSIFSALRNLFNINLLTQKIQVQTPQQVGGYTRVNGVEVSAYTRNVTQTVAQTSTSITAGSGAMTSSLVKDASGIVAELSEEKTHQSELKNIVNRNPKNDFKTNSEYKFYYKDDLDRGKVQNFINAVVAIGNMPNLVIGDIEGYFDDTLWGKGDNGVVVTDLYIYCVGGFGADSFYLDISNIISINFSGMVNKKIILETSEKKYEMILTQSNKGAEIVYELIKSKIYI